MSLEPSPRLTAKCCVASVCRAPTPSMVLSRKWRPCSTLPDTHDAACVCSHGSQSRPLIASTARPAPSTTPSEPRSVFRAIVASTRPQAPPRAPCVRPAPTARLQDARPRAPSACTSVSLHLVTTWPRLIYSLCYEQSRLCLAAWLVSVRSVSGGHLCPSSRNARVPSVSGGHLHVRRAVSPRTSRTQ